MEYLQFDWQKPRIKGTLKKKVGYPLHIQSPNNKPKQVIPYIDENKEIFIKNPYNVNWLPFKICDFYHTENYKNLLKQIN